MIKFLLLLPIKIIGLIFIAIGAILDGVNRRRIEQAKQDERRRREQYRIEQAAQREQDRRKRAARIATERAERLARIEKEKAEKAEKRKAEEKKKAYAAKTKLWQAKKDYYHYIEQIKELTRLYNELNEQY